MHGLRVLLLAGFAVVLSPALRAEPAAAPVEFVVQGVDICLNCTHELKDIQPPKLEGKEGKVTVHQEGGRTVYEEMVSEHPITATLNRLEEQGLVQRVFTAPVMVAPGGEPVTVPVAVAEPGADPAFTGVGTLQMVREGDEYVVKVSFPAGQLPFTTLPLASTVRLTPGSTLTIAGAAHESTYQSTARVPVLSDLPLVGRWFVKKRTETTRAQFMIFLTAK